MKPFECDVYMDLMPLVKDGVASDASCCALKDHMALCKKCRAAYNGMTDFPELDDRKEETFRKIQKKVKIQTVVTVLLLIVICLVPAVWLCIWNGNPISETIVRMRAAEYLENQYPNNDFTVSEPRYSMKSMCYTVEVQSRSSRDTHFVLTYGYFGTGGWDGYEEYVLSGTNTFSRISEEVESLIGQALTDVEFDSVGLNSDWPSIYDEFGDPFMAQDRIIISDLEVDGVYDCRQLSEQYGKIEINVEVTEASVEEICRILRQVYDCLKAQDLAVQTVQVTVWDQDSSMTVSGFRFADICAEDLEILVEQAAADWEAFQEDFDAWILEKNGN